ncbi:hypothetical protein Glove_9g122 [Diversispora epigaea]|uniref:Uncharacterized protein n=1 Tax=Diversispora epigaea TaxID=1348612 RepID=A0A397JV35_9GLOM|nr:hypothetical protein Glove_9g122 [Diversispora epigaea]
MPPQKNKSTTIYQLALDSKFNTPGTYTQFEKAFVDEEMTVNIIKDLSDNQLEKLALDSKFNTPGTYTQFEKAFVDEEMTVNIIKDLSDNQLEKLGETENITPNVNGEYYYLEDNKPYNSANIDAKNIVLPSLESSALRLSNRSLIILSSSIFMKLLPIDICEVTFVRRRFIKVPLNLYPSILIKSSTDEDNSVNIDVKNIVLPSLESSALRLSNRSLIILSSSIFMNIDICEVTFVRRQFIKVPLNLYPSILIKSSTDEDNSANIDAKNIVLPSLESSAFRLSNCSLIILSSSIFMKLLPFEYCKVLILGFLKILKSYF